MGDTGINLFFNLHSGYILCSFCENLFHKKKPFSICVLHFNKTEMMFFWNCLGFFYDITDVGDLISRSTAFSKSSLNVWKFTVHVLLKPGLENFKPYFTSM